MQKRIGILGGTFDPIHNGHLLAAEQAREQVGLDEVWFMPAYIPPHKEHKGIAEARHRLRMTELATADHPAFRVTDIECRRSGPSYSIDTMRELTRTYPDVQFFFIIGGDMVEMLPSWHMIEELVSLVRFVGLARPRADYDEAALARYVTFVDMPAWDLSSTLIREKVRAGRSLRYLVPAAVTDYIKEQGLYGAVAQSGETAGTDSRPDE
ncbi:nicotinate-nucleotide adenylyltransferase [Brevibacillus massiliensis]|jgi:nicotinate-nucleotide adenylyltransferase|uniref:nicotinate-nucleotide adenylyltransferase n=1 Tax=Brevibacillus massiliensis TaxID=1118054 RepID=UPI00031174A7|nr:nicotinate-nucleotide adenylyltransferase [Brevibacillus massiliensis]